MFEDTQETVLGVLSNKEVLIAQSRGQIGRGDAVTETMRDVDFIPETVSVSDAFDAMQEKRLSMMLVTNEYGGIAGLVTLKQLTGVIVGTLIDDDPPAEAEHSSIVELDDGGYLLDGGITIIEINDRLESSGIAVPEGDYNTIAGLILHEREGEIPSVFDTVLAGDLVVTVTDMAGARINKVRLEKVSTPSRESAG